MASKRGKGPRDDSSKDGDAPEDGANRSTLIKAGIGIGSAALVAALLYANHARKKKVDASDE